MRSRRITVLRPASAAATAPSETESKAASCLRSHVGRLRTVSNDYRFTRIQIARNYFRGRAVGNSDDNIFWLWIPLGIQHKDNFRPLQCPLRGNEFDLL